MQMLSESSWKVAHWVRTKKWCMETNGVPAQDMSSSPTFSSLHPEIWLWLYIYMFSSWRLCGVCFVCIWRQHEVCSSNLVSNAEPQISSSDRNHWLLVVLWADEKVGKRFPVCYYNINVLLHIHHLCFRWTYSSWCFTMFPTAPLSD